MQIIENKRIKGLIITDQLWQKEVIVTGDITIMPFSSVEIMPGTKVLFVPNQDLCSAGDGDILDEMTKNDPTATKEYARTHCSLTVLGNLTAIGAKNKPIVFTSLAKKPKETDWNGLTFFGSQASGFLDNTEVSYSHYGPSVHFTDNVYIYDSKVTNCFWSGINSFMSSPVFIGNYISTCGHEGFDLHESGALILNNIVENSLVGMVINQSRKGKPSIVKNNKIINCANFMCLQDNVKVIVRDNIFKADQNKLPKKFSYKGFTIPYDTSSMGIEICDNADVLLENNYFSGAKHYSIKYSRIGPNEGINRSTFTGVPFEIKGHPDKIIIRNNLFENTAAIDIADDVENVVIKDNKFL